MRVDRSRLWCDVAQFEEHLDAGDPKAAVALYRGELLCGFHMSDASEFEHWLDQERKHLAKRALTATLELSKEAERSGDFVAAPRWARRATEIGPYDESAPPNPLSVYGRSKRDAERRLEDALGDQADEIGLHRLGRTDVLLEIV